MASSVSKRVTLTNSGTGPLHISGITVTGDFSQTNNYSSAVAVGGACHIDVTFTPTATGTRIGQLTINSDAPGSPHHVPLSGNGIPAVEPLARLSISGNQFVTPTGTKVRLKSVNWFGAESTNYLPHGCWARRWTDMLDQMKSFGFNCIRFPFSGDFCTPGRTPPTTVFDASKNAEFVGKTSLQILDLIVDWCQTNHMYIVLDHHRCSAGAGTDSGIVAPYSEAQWHNDWVVLANRYKDNTCVVGADVHNEPYMYTWTAWKALVEPCAEAILAVAPDWLIFVEGVGAFTGTANGVTYDNDNTWWGGQFLDVWNHPITLSVPHKVVYSPHEYGQSVGSQTWLSRDGAPVAGYPTGIYTQIHKHWGWIYENNIAPIWVGEMGGHFGLDGNGNLTKPHRVPETEWMQAVVKILNGDFANLGTNQDTAGNAGMSFAWWGYPPNSGDTGGLVQDDWITPQQPKLDVIAPLFTDIPAPETGTLRIHVSGNEFVKSNGQAFRLKSVCWYGAESNIYVPAGLWAQNYKDVINQIAAWGFNSIRIPISGEFCRVAGTTYPTSAVNYTLNPTMTGMTAFQVMDEIISYADSKGLYIIFDHHNRSTAAGGDGSPISSSYTVENWISDWLILANRYKDTHSVIGADISNEPYALDWNTWAGLAEQCGNAIHAVAPNWLIFVQGVGNYDGHYYTWGGSLRGVASRPVALTLPNKVVYSPHDYGQSNGAQPWLAMEGGSTPSGWPNNLFTLWHDEWGFIYENNIAPIWVGEFGGLFGYNGDGSTGAPNGTLEQVWLTQFIKYVNGDFNGDGTKDIATGKLGISFDYFTVNGNPGGVGGLYKNDWSAPIPGKISLLSSLLT